MNALSRFLARFIFLRWMALLGLMLGAASSALATKTYSDNGDGTVTDPTTGLQWMRCSMGQTWDGSTCTGTASNYSWYDANALTGTVTFAGQNDWRLPNIRELQTIVERSAYNPAIDTVAFPNTPPSYFWSASASAGGSDSAWYVYFYFGYAGSYSKYVTGQVRLVRSGQSFGLLDVARPSTDYVDQGNGTVTHTPTSLMWQRCAVGQTWTGSTCSGTASTFIWDAAMLLTSTFAGQNDWRLPTEEELISLVDYSTKYPAINTTLFPNTPSGDFWSASAYASYSDGAWYIHFYFGYAYYNDKYGAGQVRLVRAGQCLGPFALTVSKTGTGQVTSSGPTGAGCDPLSGSGYYSGDVLTLNATPAANLISWSGACSGSAATCIVTMDAAKTVTASFKDTPLISGLPSALTFALQNIGSTSAAQNLILANIGTASLAISSIAAGGDYDVTHNCGTGLGAGGFCTLNITFMPTAIGVRTGTVTITSDAPGSPHSVSLSGTGSFNIIDHYYTNILNRPADDAGKAFWQSEVTRMSNLGASASEAYIAMARYFFTSQEFLARGFNDDQFVQDLYLTFFNRGADQTGLNYWNGQLASGLPRDMVMYAFMFSPEFSSFMSQNVGTSYQRAEVGAVVDYYRGAFGRLPDDGGLKYWVNQFRGAQCSGNPTGNVYATAVSIAGSFFGGPDYWAVPPTPSKYDSDLYNAFMRRGADLNGFNYWVNQLSTGAQSYDAVRKSFIDSTEFRARVQAIAGQACTGQMQ